MISKKLTDVQIQQFRRHAEQYPLGDTAKLLAHIDWMHEQLNRVIDLWENEFGFSELDLIMSIESVMEDGE